MYIETVRVIDVTSSSMLFSLVPHSDSSGGTAPPRQKTARGPVVPPMAFDGLCTVWFDRYNNDNDNDKRLGLTAEADQPDHKKYNTPKIKMDNEAVQELHTS